MSFGYGNYIGYFNYIIFLFFASGVIMLWLDVNAYKSDKRKKEEKAARISGWLNVSLGVVVLIGSWLYKRYVW